MRDGPLRIELIFLQHSVRRGPVFQGTTSSPVVSFIFQSLGGVSWGAPSVFDSFLRQVEEVAYQFLGPMSIRIVTQSRSRMDLGCFFGQRRESVGVSELLWF